MASTMITPPSAYEALCDAVDRLGGSVRLSRGDSWGLTVTVTFDERERLPRAAGFFFLDFEELDDHARLILSWLAGPSLVPTKGGQS